jgi:hypothetical protein
MGVRLLHDEVVMPRRRPDLSLRNVTTLLVALAAIGIACGRSSTEPGAANAVADAAAKVAQVAATVTGQEARLADQQLDGRHLGFDTHTYPGDKTMRAWKTAENAPYSWVGYYLVAPCHKDDSWSGKRQTLTDMGWGLAAVYVGQQTWGRTPKPLTPRRLAQLQRSKALCNADYLGAERGVAEGKDAIAKATAEGFAPRSVIFLDIERMERMPQAMRDYHRAWARTLLQNGRYLPGVYVHAHNAQDVHDDLKAEFLAAGVKEDPRVWVATGRGFDESKAPHEVGFTFAGMWQGMIDVARAVADIRLPVDVNVSSWISPSDPAAAVD